MTSRDEETTLRRLRVIKQAQVSSSSVTDIAANEYQQLSLCLQNHLQLFKDQLGQGGHMAPSAHFQACTSSQSLWIRIRPPVVLSIDQKEETPKTSFMLDLNWAWVCLRTKPQKKT